MYDNEPWRNGLSTTKVELEVAELFRRPSEKPNLDGSMGMNRTGIQPPENRKRIKISHQRIGEDLIRMGILDRDTNSIDDGLKAFAWAFRLQSPDGFYRQEKHGPHGMTFFLASVANAEMMLRDSEFQDYARPQRQEMEKSLRALALWFCGPGFDVFWRENHTMTHQFWHLSLGLGLTHKICPDQRILDRSRDVVTRAMQAQAPEGYYPELGGFDTGYNIGGAQRGIRWLHHFACDPMAFPVRESLGRSLDWQIARIRPDGTIDDTGNSRTGPGDFDRHEKQSMIRKAGDKRTKVKGPGYPNTARTLAAWSLMTGRPELWELAPKVWEKRKHRPYDEKRGRVLGLRMGI